MFIEISFPSFFTAFVCPGFQSEILVGGGNVFGSVYLVCSFVSLFTLKSYWWNVRVVIGGLPVD